MTGCLHGMPFLIMTFLRLMSFPITFGSSLSGTLSIRWFYARVRRLRSSGVDRFPRVDTTRQNTELLSVARILTRHFCRSAGNLALSPVALREQLWWLARRDEVSWRNLPDGTD